MISGTLHTKTAFPRPPFLRQITHMFLRFSSWFSLVWACPEPLLTPGVGEADPGEEDPEADPGEVVPGATDSGEDR